MTNPNKFNEEVGLLRRGWVDSYDPETDTIDIKLNNSPINSSNPAHTVPAPHTLFQNNGIYIGTLPDSGTPVVCAMGSGGQYYIVSFLAENLPVVPTLTTGQLLIQTNDDTKISLDTDNNITIGSDADRLHINTDSHFISSNIDNEYNFTQASRHVKGVVKRDLVINTNFDQNSKLESDNYDPNFFVIGMDPTASPTSVIVGSNKNPPLVEDREMHYEFQYESSINNDLVESTLYGTTHSSSVPPPPDLNRRTSRADTMSLTLDSPNYLMEVVKGTVVDIFGNILDLNRNPIPVGQGQNTLQASNSSNKVQAFINIKALERKSIAYHFEINARKDLAASNGTLVLPDINSNADYSRNRSRFFFDIDKEGQFKMNVPASSNTGNIPLLTRAENYSSFGTTDNGNTDQLTFITDNKDIFLDSFAAPLATINNSGFNYATPRGSIKLIDGNGGDGAPLDRITTNIIGTPTHIMHGTVYHDILQTCYMQQTNNYLNYQLGTSTVPIIINDQTFPPLTNVVSDTITISGASANAGGRSGSINLDGSLEVNIGANTIDRQSLWLDTAGGIVANVGRDLQNRSAMMSLNGDVYLQIGGFGVSGDSRFKNAMNGAIGAKFDIRVMDSGGQCHIIRFDDNGITIMSHGNLQIHSAKDLTLSADHNMTIDAETLTVQERGVLKVLGGSV
jgi:hypothetical protein